MIRSTTTVAVSPRGALRLGAKKRLIIVAGALVIALAANGGAVLIDQHGDSVLAQNTHDAVVGYLGTQGMKPERISCSTTSCTVELPAGKAICSRADTPPVTGQVSCYSGETGPFATGRIP